MSDLRATFRLLPGLDPRGLLPIDDARAHLATLSESPPAFAFDRADRLWQALLSLADADELVREARRLRLVTHPRGHYNVALHERYGDAILPWLADHLDRASGALVNVPWNVIPNLLRIERDEAFEILLDAKTLESAPHDLATPEKLLGAYVSGHPAVALGVLARRTLAGDAGAEAWLKKLSKGRGRAAVAALEAAGGAEAAARMAKKLGLKAKLEEGEILAVLDGAASKGEMHAWPRFSYGFEDRVEYAALRMIAARDAESDAWGIALERVTGCNPDEIGIERYLYGSEVPPGLSTSSPQVPLAIALEIDETATSAIGATARAASGAVTVTDALVKELDLRPGHGTEPDGTIGGPTVVLVRAALATLPGAIWPPVDDAVRALRLDPASAVRVACTDAFAHVEGAGGEGPAKLPSSSKAYKTVAKAIVNRDPARLDPGKPTTDWRAHARFRAR